MQDVNDHAPEFQNTPYHLEVDELTPVGVTVFRGIHAIDRDKPNTANSDITYSIVVSIRTHVYIVSTPCDCLYVTSFISSEKPASFISFMNLYIFFLLLFICLFASFFFLFLLLTPPHSFSKCIGQLIARFSLSLSLFFPLNCSVILLLYAASTSEALSCLFLFTDRKERVKEEKKKAEHSDETLTGRYIE